MKLRVGTLCSGYDSQCMALDRLKENFPDFDYELVFWSEIDKYAIQAHNAVYPQWADRNLGDMTKIDWSKVEPIDLLTYSTPCQSISNAGLQHGFTEGSGTRSSIIWNVRDAVKALHPKYLMLENVKAMVEEKFLPMFNLWRTELVRLGYDNYAQVLNAKDYGIPQNRERIFLISIRHDNQPTSYHFPEPSKLDKRLKDVLEQNVDEKYYLSEKTINMFNDHQKRSEEAGNGFGWKPTNGGGIAACLRAGTDRPADNYIKENECSVVSTQERYSER